MEENKVSIFSKFNKVFLVVAIELMFLVGFSFGGSITFNLVFGLVIFLLIVLATYQQYKKDRIVIFLIFIVPILVYGLVSVLSNFARIELDLTTKILLPISLVAFASAGYCYGYNKKFSINSVMLAIYLGIAVISIVNLIITIAKLGVFYSFKYETLRVYEAGNPSYHMVPRIAYAVIGFSIETVSIEYYSLFPIMLLSSAPFLFFISPKKELKKFVIYCLFTLVGLLSVVLTINKYIAISLSLVVITLALIICVFKFKKLQCKKTFIAFLIVCGIVFLLLIFQIINAQENSFIYNWTHSNSFLNKIFNANGFADLYNKILRDAFKGTGIFGFTTSHDLMYQASYIPSGNILVDQFMYGGLFLFIFFIIICGLGVYAVYKTLKYSKNRKEYVLALSFVATYFVFNLLSGNVIAKENSNSLFPFYLQPMFLLVLFLIGYFVNTNKEKEEEINE